MLYIYGVLYFGPGVLRSSQNFMLACQENLNKCLRSSTTASFIHVASEKKVNEPFISRSVS